jgi:hypothetical protein
MLYRAAVVALFLAAAFWRQDPGWFGYYHDDTLYLASARALATGEGYVIPSLPGAPPQTKYPVLYPLLLAGVWKMSPRFPDNLPLALGLTTLFGAALVAGWFALLEQLGASGREAAVITAVSALHPFVLSLSGAVLSDIPFMALAVWAVVLAGRSAWWASAACALAAVLLRSIGVSVVAGIVLYLVLRRSYRPAGAFLLLVLPAAAGLRAAAPTGLAGYQQTLLFYTSYGGFWRLSVPDAATLGSLLATNALEVLKAPASLCFPLPHLPESPWVQGGVLILLSFTIVVGVARLRRHVIHYVLLFYAAITLLWNYPLANRFLVFFLPVFWLGAFRLALALPRRKLLAPVAAVLLFESAWTNFHVLPDQLASAAEVRRSLAREKAEAYEWIAARTGPEDRFIAYEDVLLYLHTGRQAIRALALTSPPRPDRDLPKLADTARQIRARFWLVAADDHQLEEPAAALAEATARSLQGAPVVFRARAGNVQIHQLSGP